MSNSNAIDDETKKNTASLDETITLSQGPGLDFKDVYLKARIGKSNFFTIMGVHAVGFAEQHTYKSIGLDGEESAHPTNFKALEVWGNEYDEEHSVVGRGRFLVYTKDIDSYVRELESEGWVRTKKPQKKRNE